jgi:hypothetical protein
LANPGKEESSGWIVDLESPDKRTRVHVKLVSVALSPAFSHPLTEEQIQQQRVAQDEQDREYQREEAVGIRVMSRYTPPYSDPLSREDRLLGRGVDGFKLAEGSPIEFSSEKVSNKEFVRAQADLYAGNVRKKCLVWALNLRGYRLKESPTERRASTWICLNDEGSGLFIIHKTTKTTRGQVYLLFIVVDFGTGPAIAFAHGATHSH